MHSGSIGVGVSGPTTALCETIYYYSTPQYTIRWLWGSCLFMNAVIHARVEWINIANLYELYGAPSVELAACNSNYMINIVYADYWVRINVSGVLPRHKLGFR